LEFCGTGLAGGYSDDVHVGREGCGDVVGGVADEDGGVVVEGLAGSLFRAVLGDGDEFGALCVIVAVGARVEVEEPVQVEDFEL
jgi:hypothetical protein